jgi:hypothetical protein
MRVQQHRDQNNRVAEEHGCHRLFPVHASLDQAGGQHVGQNIDRHRYPQRGETVGAPGTLLAGRRREVRIVERTGFDP